MNNPDSQEKNTGSARAGSGLVRRDEEAPVQDDFPAEDAVESPLPNWPDGDEYEEVIPSKTFRRGRGSEEATIILNISKVSKVALSFLTDAILQGAREGWDTQKDKPDENFIEQQGAEIEKIVKALATGWKEDCVVYDLLKSEPMPTLSNRERAVRDGLLARASRSCPR